jgi:NAD(P)-dependent dehydrogenase (short-subunit alcohol dehydrogenase family)
VTTVVADDFVAADLASATGVAVVAAHVRDSGGAQILVHVAGGSEAPSGGFAVLTDQDWADDLNLNLLAAVRRTVRPRATRRESWTADDDRKASELPDLSDESPTASSFRGHRR